MVRIPLSPLESNESANNTPSRISQEMIVDNVEATDFSCEVLAIMFTHAYGYRAARMIAQKMDEFPYPDYATTQEIVLEQLAVEADRFPWN